MKKEFKQKEKSEKSVSSYQDKENNIKTSIINPSQLQYHNDSQEDQKFFAKLENLVKEYGKLDKL